LFHSGFRGELGTGGSDGEALGLAGDVLKICVKLPSPEADPETPGDEYTRVPPAAGADPGLAKSSLTRGACAGD
jgi:hypothetical protein